MDADNDDRPHYHHLDGGILIDDVATLNRCCDDECTDDHAVIVPLDDYRNLVAAARDRHPAGQQRGPDPASRTDDGLSRDFWPWTTDP